MPLRLPNLNSSIIRDTVKGGCAIPRGSGKLNFVAAAASAPKLTLCVYCVFGALCGEAICATPDK